MTTDFFVEIIESSRELTPKERVMAKQVSSAHKLDELTQDGDIILKPEAYVLLRVNNEKSKGDKTYETMVLIDHQGEMYITGSISFRNAVIQLWDDYCELLGEGEDCGLRVYRMPSKNYKGKEFITATII